MYKLVKLRFSSGITEVKVLVENTKKELCYWSFFFYIFCFPKMDGSWICRNQQIEAISTKLQVDKSDLKPFLPK
jgi:hypothetical protein